VSWYSQFLFKSGNNWPKVTLADIHVHSGVAMRLQSVSNSTKYSYVLVPIVNTFTAGHLMPVFTSGSSDLLYFIAEAQELLFWA
jgi:hypothetical protein